VFGGTALGSERGKGTLFDEVATFHSASSLIENPCAIGGRTLRVRGSLAANHQAHFLGGHHARDRFHVRGGDVFIDVAVLCAEVFLRGN